MTKSVEQRKIFWPGKAALSAGRQWKAFWRSAWSAMPKGIWLAGLLLILAYAALARVPSAISRPMTHDEAYTFIAFASQPLPTAVSDYHLPNNHILNTVLVHFATRIFGEQALAIRIPAVTAGVLTVLAIYLLTRAQYGDPAALLASALAAYLTAMIDVSVLARGYSLLALLMLLDFLLALYLRKQRNVWGWLLFSVIAAFGFFTVPTMLYPIGVIGLWLAVSGLAGETGKGYPTRWHFIACLAGAAVLAAGLTVLLYTPVLRVSGLDALINNPFVQPLNREEFAQILPNRVKELWGIWQEGIAPLLWLLLAGLVPAALLAHRSGTGRIPPQIGLAWVPLVVYLQQPNPWTKIFMFLLPLLLIWGTGGWFLLAGKWVKYERLAVTAVVLSAAIMAAGILRDVPKQLDLPAKPGEVEQAVIAVTETYQPGDALAAASPDDAPAWYYARLHGLNKDAYSYFEERDISTVYVLVNPEESQSVETVLIERQLAPEDYNIPHARLIYDQGGLQVYLLKKK
jgi:hypothetical protein